MRIRRMTLWGMMFLGGGALGINAWYIITRTCPMGWLIDFGLGY